MTEYRQPKKKSFKLFYDTVESLLDNFNDEEVGALFRAISSYEMYGEIPDFSDRAMLMVFNQFKSALDRNMESYNKQCETNRENRTMREEKRDFTVRNDS